MKKSHIIPVLAKFLADHPDQSKLIYEVWIAACAEATAYAANVVLSIK